MPRKAHVHPGQTYGLLTVVAPAKSDVRGDRRWACACSCGNPRTVVAEAHLNRTTSGRKTCGECHTFLRAKLDPLTLSLTARALQNAPKRKSPTRRMATRAELAEIERFMPKVGTIYGCLRVTGEAPRIYADGSRFIECECNCGKAHVMVKAIPLIRGRMKSCGCLNTTGKSTQVKVDARRVTSRSRPKTLGQMAAMPNVPAPS